MFQMRTRLPTLLGANVAEVWHITYSEWLCLCVFHPCYILNIAAYLKNTAFHGICFVFQM